MDILVAYDSSGILAAVDAKIVERVIKFHKQGCWPYWSVRFKTIYDLLMAGV